ncbi:translation initiation factor IF-2-like [Ochotona curzoniae]|uniref:translation initiation factor IF-2-like n=1 Tax=Ochotona curzoniae TaxID=130825 RepID=UPI001B345CD9|nr:translation initiation factor IF-2-like [Ochotona curzoniae]
MATQKVKVPHSDPGLRLPQEVQQAGGRNLPLRLRSGLRAGDSPRRDRCVPGCLALATGLKVTRSPLSGRQESPSPALALLQQRGPAEWTLRPAAAPGTSGCLPPSARGSPRGEAAQLLTYSGRSGWRGAGASEGSDQQIAGLRPAPAAPLSARAWPAASGPGAGARPPSEATAGDAAGPGSRRRNHGDWGRRGRRLPAAAMVLPGRAAGRPPVTPQRRFKETPGPRRPRPANAPPGRRAARPPRARGRARLPGGAEGSGPWRVRMDLCRSHSEPRPSVSQQGRPRQRGRDPDAPPAPPPREPLAGRTLGLPEAPLPSRRG